MRTWQPEHAEGIPFSRKNIAAVLGVSSARVNNWIDRNRLWQTHRSSRFHRHYTLVEIFDLAGFSAMRTAHIPEQVCAKHVYNYGFYRSFLHGDQATKFSHRKGKWDIGIYDPSAVLTLSINMRALGEGIFRRLAEETLIRPNDWPDGSFESFRRLYGEALVSDRVDVGSAPMFEAAESKTHDP